MVKLTNLIGIPFVSKGRDPVLGMDCWGLVMHVFGRYGITLPDFKIEASNLQRIDIITHEAVGHSSWEGVPNPTEGDVPLVVLMQIHPTYVTHAGIYIDNNRIMHTMEATGVVISKRATLASRIVGFYRYAKDN